MIAGASPAEAAAAHGMGEPPSFRPLGGGSPPPSDGAGTMFLELLRTHDQAWSAAV